MEPARKFKIIVNSKECGTCSGATPSAVAKKVVKKLCGSSSKTVSFSLKECKRGCERVCGPYQGRMEKLDRPYKRDGKTIAHRVVCGKVRKMRGGELGQDGENLTMDDFKVQDQSVPFLRLETIGKLGIFSTKEQYAFFNPLNNNEFNNNERSQAETEPINENQIQNRIYYQYVAIRKRNKDIVFKKLNLNEKLPENIEPKDIKLKILKQLSEEINKKIENRELVADTIQKELKRILTNRISELNTNENNSNENKNNSDLKNSFKISNNSSGNIFVLEKGKRTSKLFGNKKQYIFFHKVENNNEPPFYQFVAIRHENQDITFKDSELNEVSIENIPENILLQLLNDINKYRQNKHNKHFATSIMKKLREYLHYNNTNINRYFRVPTKLSSYDTYGDFFYIKTINREKKYYISFKPVVNNRNHQSTEYEYMVIIDVSGIMFMKKEISNGSSSHIRRISINDIPIDILYYLYSQLLGNHLENIPILENFLNELKKFTTEYGKYKEWVESILKNPIRKTDSGNKITNSKSQNHEIKYFGKFSFDFISKYTSRLTNQQTKILKEWLGTILEKQQIRQGKKPNTYIFKPRIESIESSISNYNNERTVV